MSIKYFHLNSKVKKQKSINSTAHIIHFGKNEIIIDGKFSQIQNVSSIRIDSFYFGTIHVNTVIHIIKDRYYLDISHPDLNLFLKGVDVFEVKSKYFYISNIHKTSIIETNNVKLIELESNFDDIKTEVMCEIKIIKKNNVHIDEINKIHFIKEINGNKIKVQFPRQNDFTIDSQFSLSFINQNFQYNESTYDILYNLSFSELKIVNFFFPPINNISPNYKNNEFVILDEKFNTYKVYIPSRLWKIPSLLQYINDQENSRFRIKIKLDEYDPNFFEMYFFKKVNIIKSDNHWYIESDNLTEKTLIMNSEGIQLDYNIIDPQTFISKSDISETFVFISTPFKFIQNNFYSCLGLLKNNFQLSHKNQTPVYIPLLLSVNVRINNLEESHLLYLYDQENQNNTYEISFFFTKTIINTISIIFKIDDYIADFNNQDYNFIIRFS